MLKYNSTSVNDAYTKHITDSQNFSAGMNTLRSSIQKLIDTDQLSGSYSRSLISFMNLVVLGAVDAVDLGKEMYNEKFKEFEKYAKDTIDQGGEVVLVEDGIEAIYKYSHAYNEFLVGTIDKTNRLLDNVRNNMSYVNRPIEKQRVWDIHDSVYAEVVSIREDMLTVAHSNRPKEMLEYFGGMNQIIHYMSECIFPLDNPPVRFKAEDLMIEPWYAKHNKRSLDYYRGKDYAYFAERNPLSMPYIMKEAIAEKLANALNQGDEGAADIERFLELVLSSAYKEGNSISNPRSMGEVIGEYFSGYASIMQGYAITKEVELLNLLSEPGSYTPGLVVNKDVGDLLANIERLYTMKAIFDGLKDEAGFFETLYVTHNLDKQFFENPNVDLLFSMGNSIDYSVKIGYEDNGRNETKVICGTNDDLSKRQNRELADGIISESQKRQNKAASDFAMMLLSSKAPAGSMEALDAILVSAGLYESYTDDALRRANNHLMSAEGTDFRCKTVKSTDGSVHFIPTQTTLNILHVLNANGGNYTVMDLNDYDKLIEMNKSFEAISINAICYDAITGDDRELTPATKKANIQNYGSPCG